MILSIWFRNRNHILGFMQCYQTYGMESTQFIFATKFAFWLHDKREREKINQVKLQLDLTSSWTGALSLSPSHVITPVFFTSGLLRLDWIDVPTKCLHASQVHFYIRNPKLGEKYHLYKAKLRWGWMRTPTSCLVSKP